MRTIFIIIAGSLVSASPLAAHDSTPKGHHQTTLSVSAREAAATVDAFHAALRRGETQAAAALLTDDALVYESGGVEQTKAEYEAQHLAADAEFARAVRSAVTRRIGDADGQWAWIASEGRMTGEFKGRAVDRVSTETMILRRQGPGWKIVHIHWSSAPAP